MTAKTITIPMAMLQEMAKYPEEIWSEAAREWITHRLRILTSTPPTPLVHPGLERLRKQKEDKYSKEYQTGLIAGETWALRVAHYTALKALVAVRYSTPEDMIGVVSSFTNQKLEPYPYSLGFVTGVANIYDQI